MKNNSEKKAALYVRVSTDAQRDEGYSIEAQEEMLKAYCISKGIKYYELYTDGGFSGSNIDRPELTRMVSDIENGKISHVVVYKLDRFSRSQKDTLFLIEDVLIPNEVSFVSLNENMDTSTPIGRAMLGIMSAFAQLERETIKERTRMGMKERIKQGYWRGGGKIPFGYDYDTVRGILVPNSDAEKVKIMYDLYLKGWSMMSIATYVGLKYERLAEQILKRKTNCGYILYNGKEYKGRHEGIISEETYDRTMKAMKERRREGYGSKSLLSGLIVCGVCGSKMRYQKWGKSGYKIYCYSQDKGKSHLAKGSKCNNIKVWADEVEEAVIGDLFSMSKKEIEDNGRKKEGRLDVLINSDIDKLNKKLKNLYNLYGDSGDDALKETINQVKSELENAKERLKNFKAERENENSQNQKREQLKNVSEAWEYMTFDEKRSVLKSLIEKIVITYDNTDIYYKITH